MSASSKKKLRKEQNAAALTEKQQQQLKKEKTLKHYTMTFVICMVLVVCIGLGIVLYNPIARTIDKNTVALHINGNSLNTTMLNYFLGDAIDSVRAEYQETYGDYAYIYAGMNGLDVYTSLEDQNHPEETEKTWAQVFVEQAIEDASKIYGLYYAALDAGHKLTEDEEITITSDINTITAYAMYYAGYTSLDAFLRTNYGSTASEETYTEYLRVKAYAESYSTKYYDSLEYTDDDYREHEKDDYYYYSSYNFSAYDVIVGSYYKGGTKDEEGKTTYSDEEIAAAQSAAKIDAEALGNGTYKDSTEFDKAIAALEVNKDKKDVASTLYTNQFGGKKIADEEIREWLCNKDRKTGDVAMFPNTSKDEDGKETITSYTVIMFQSSTDNHMKLVNVRHILLKFETTIDSEGKEIVSPGSKAAAEKEAKELLEKYKTGKEQTAEAFGALAKEHSDDGSARENGLIQNIRPGETVSAFNDWCFDTSRKVGDTEIIETEFGYHVMFFDSFCDKTYRDSMIDSNLRDDATSDWIDEIVEKLELEVGDTSRLYTDRNVG